MYKQAIVIRQDLKMGKGKIVAQASHASLQAYLNCEKNLAEKWLAEGAKKIAVKVNRENELIELERKARKMKISIALVRDAGHTQVAPGTLTALGIGPASEEEIDEVSGKLKLL